MLVKPMGNKISIEKVATDTTHHYIGNNPNKYVHDGKFSYHITKEINDGYFTMFWPFTDLAEYCENLETAEKEFQKLIRELPNTSFKLTKYEAVSCDGKIVGVSGSPIILKIYSPRNVFL